MSSQTEWTDGVPVPALAGEQIVERFPDAEVLLITRRSSEEERRRAARVALRAMADTPFHTPAFTADDADPDVHIFLARHEGRAIALAVLRPKPRWAWWSWDDFEAERRPTTAVATMTSWTVELIWTLGRVQHAGLARRLLLVASRVVEQPVASFGWRRPFTPSGEEFVRRLCPDGFWVPD
jgi:hypothetical protein